jgi:hypothetical protein
VECEWRNAKITVDGINVEIEVGFRDIKIVVQGRLSDTRSAQLCEEVLMNTQSLFQCRCSLERL